MAHPQNSARGLFAKRQINVDDGSGNVTAITANSSGIVLDAGLKLSSQANATITGNSTGVVFAASIKISNARYITANSTAYTFTTESGLPGNVDGAGGLTAITNSTGHAFGINTTGTTWLWVSGTSVQPTT